MADGMGKDLMTFAAVILGLFLIMIIVGVTYIGGGYLRESLCEQNLNPAGGNYYWDGGDCYNESSGGGVVTITAINKIAIVEAVIDIALGLLSLVVIMLLFKIVIKTAKGFGNIGG